MGYFLDDSGNFENFVKIWTRRPPNYYQNASKNTRKIMESSWKNIIYVNLGLTKFRKFLNSGPTRHLFFLKVFWPPPQKKIGISERFQSFFDVAWMFGIWTIIFWKYLNISKSYWIKIYFEKVSILSEQIWRRVDCWYLWTIIFLNFLVRVHSWYLWKIHFLNFRDFH